MNTRQKLPQLHLNEWATRFAEQNITVIIAYFHTSVFFLQKLS